MADIQNVYLQMGRDSKDCTHLLRKRITGTKCQMLKKSYTSNTRLVLKPQMDSCKKKTEQDFSSDLNSSHLWNNFSIFNFQTLQWIQLILAYPYITAVYIWYTACVSVTLAWTLLSCKSKWSGKNYIIGVNRSECTSYGMGCVKLKPVRSHY